MFRVPVTYLFDFDFVSDNLRPCILQEFAACGAKHLVLSDKLVERILPYPDFADTLRDELAACGLTFFDAHAPFGLTHDMFSPFPEKRGMMIARQKLVLEICSYLGVNNVTMHLGSSRLAPANSIPLDVHVNRMKESLAELLPFAEKLGVSISIENSWYPTASPDLLCAIKEEFPTPALGFCYDAGHANIMDNGRNFAEGNAHRGWRTCGFDGNPPWEKCALEKMLPHVLTCHLHDNMGDSDTHTIPGRGTVNWKHIVPLLNSAPRIKVIQCEVLPCRNTLRIADIVAKFDELAQYC